MSTASTLKTPIDAQMVISKDDFNEFEQLKLLSKALGIGEPHKLTKGRLIRLKRAWEGLSMSDLSQKGFDRGHLKKIENDAVELNSVTAQKITKEFGTDFTDFLSTLPGKIKNK